MWIPWVWLGGISKYGPRPSKLESNTNLRPTAVGRYWAPISQDIGPYLLIPPLQTHSISPITWHLFVTKLKNLMVFFNTHTSQKWLYMVIETCGYGRGLGGTGLMWVDPWSFIFEFARGNFENLRIFYFWPHFSIGEQQKLNDLTNFRQFPPVHKNWP